MKNINVIHNERRASEHIENIKSQWMFLAMVLDKSLLVVFAVVTMTATVTILVFRPSSSDIYERIESDTDRQYEVNVGSVCN